MKYLLSLGSNSGNRIGILEEACNELKAIGHVFRRSSIYESEPYGLKSQPSFLNALCYLETSYRPFRLLWKLKAIELKLGRERSFRWGPRCIDLDILDWEGEMVKTNILTIPHKELEKRNFILNPLREMDSAYRNRSGSRLGLLINNCRDTSWVQLFKQQW